MLSIGAHYYKACTFDATTYLVVGGSIMVISNILVFIALKTPMECDDKLMNALMPAIGLAQFCIFLWGTIVVFGHYSGWTYNALELLSPDKYYCAYTPFMFAFVLLILKWVLLPFIIVFCCCCACFTRCCGKGGDEAAV